MQSGPLTVVVVSNYQALEKEDFAARYSAFLAQLGGFYPLLWSPASIRMSRCLYERSRDEPWFLVVYAGQSIVALLPLHRERFGFGLLQFKRLRLWGKVGCYNDLHSADFLALPEYAEPAAEALVDHLQQKLGWSFDKLRLQRVRADSFLVRQLKSRLPHYEILTSDEANYIYSAQVKLAERISGETFRKIRKAKESLLAQFARVEFECVSQINEELFDELAKLHIARQHALVGQGRDRFSFFENPLERQVLFQRLSLAQNWNALRIYTLRLEGELVCFLLCIGKDESTLALITAFKDVEGHKYHARCLWHYAFQQELEVHGTQLIDMGYGGHQLKQTFSTELVPLETIIIRDKSRHVSAVRQHGWYWAKQLKGRIKKLKS